MEAMMRTLEEFQKAASANDGQQMEAAALNALMIAAEEAEKNPTPELALMEQAGECENRADWTGAEVLYGKILELPGLHQGLKCKAHCDLSRLFLLVGDLEKADERAQAATVAARQGDNSILLAMALENQATCALRRSDYTGAIQAASEALTVVPPGRMLEGMRAAALVTRARCRMSSGDLAGAEGDLAACKPILIDKPVSPLFAGVHSRVAGWWEVTASIRAQKGSFTGACEAWKEAVTTRRHVASLCHVSSPYTSAALARSMLRLGEAYEATGDSDAGKTSAAEARRIWRETGLPEQGLQEAARF